VIFTVASVSKLLHWRRETAGVSEVLSPLLLRITAGDQFVEIKAWPAGSFYFSVEPESPLDIYFHFLDFIAQRASFSELQKPILGLRDDVFNLSASLAKISHLHKTRDIVGAGVSRMVVTEVELTEAVRRRA
jgi:hypothetical protein